jgi:hypothetical protein
MVGWRGLEKANGIFREMGAWFKMAMCPWHWCVCNSKTGSGNENGYVGRYA